MNRKAKADRADIYSRITDKKSVSDLEAGVKPWMKPGRAANTHSRITMPLRHNGQPYSGTNVLLLWSEQMSRAFSSAMWMTFKQALKLGASVRKGERGSTVVFASRFTKSKSDGNGNEVDREIPFLKTYSVFNIEPIEGLPDRYFHRFEPVLDPVARIEAADHFLRGSPRRQSGFFMPQAKIIFRCLHSRHLKSRPAIMPSSATSMCIGLRRKAASAGTSRATQKIVANPRGRN